MYLLDTDHCVHLLQARPTVMHRLAEVGRDAVETCVIVRGELLYMAELAELSERRADNFSTVSALLQEMVVWSVDDETSDIYAEIKAALLNRFGPRERARRRQFDIAKLGFKDNDLWIAAVAIRRGLTVVSADGDFRRMAEVTTLKVETWWSPHASQAPP